MAFVSKKTRRIPRSHHRAGGADPVKQGARTETEEARRVEQLLVQKSQEPRVQSVAKAATILFEIAGSDAGLRAVEVSRRTGLSRQATYHLLQSLMAVGLLTRNERNNYIMGIRVGALADAFRAHLSPPEYLAPLVRRFAMETGESCNGVGWRDGEIVTLVRVTTGANAVQALGARLGLYESAPARSAGKLLLALAPEHRCRNFLSAHAPTRETEFTIVGELRLKEEFDKIRRERVAVEREEYKIGLGSFAVPVGPDLALALSAPIARFDEEFARYLTIAKRLANSAPNNNADDDE